MIINRACLTALLALVALCDLAGAKEIDNRRLAEGKAIAERLCARCHQIGLEGQSPLEPAPPFRDLASRYPLEHLEEALGEGILVGNHAMPEFRLEPQQISDLLSYIGSLSRK